MTFKIPEIHPGIFPIFVLFFSTTLMAQDISETKKISILFTTDLYGLFSPVKCDAPPQTDFANLVGTIKKIREENKRQGLSEPLVLNGGDNIGPRAFARFVLIQGQSGGEAMARWLKAAGYGLIALGNQDFYAVAQRLAAYLKGGKDLGLDFSAANLDCKTKKGICKYIGAGPGRFKMFQRDGLNIAVLSVIHADLAKLVGPGRLDNIQVEDPAQRAKEVIEAARQAGADLVIVISHTEHAETSPRTTIALARAIPDADLVIANAFTVNKDDRGIGVIRFSDGASPIIGCDLMGEHLCLAQLEAKKTGGRWRVSNLSNQELNPSSAKPDEQVRKEIEEYLKDYCSKWDKPVGKGKLARAMNPDDFRRYIMEIMRASSKSELAFINRGLVDESVVFPMKGHITRHDFFAGLPHRNKLYTFGLKGKQVNALCKKLLKEKQVSGKTRLEHLGLSCGKKNRVNGRLIDPNDTYTAITIEYLAAGVLGYFDPKKIHMKPFMQQGFDHQPILGQVARKFLSSPRFQGDNPELIDPDQNFSDLSRTLRWTFFGGLNLNLSDTAIYNDRAYDQSQLARDEFMALKGEIRARIEANSRIHGLSIDARLKYAKSSTADGPWIESEDLTTVNAVYKLKSFRDANSGWYVPMPYLESKLETELTKPQDDPATTEIDEGRSYHHLEVTATLGTRFKLLQTLEAKAGFGLRDETLDPDAKPVYGFDIGYLLKKTNLLSLLGSPLQMESQLTAFFGDLGRTNTLKGTWTNRLYFSIIGPIYFNITHELFVYRYSTWDYGIASDFTFGLSYNAQTSLQAF